ncbi:ABC-2 family transporter protein [Paenibacillus sp. GD4]|jgi:ABC-2 type transport system permease protein|uniref:ABC transporter permease n=1 Tax=Paenibacillus sp. GD4 TaxID=3068890 RepID=UPI0027964D0A|nr:ABC-2 family transporter protein [Paenibacillus sp. GD4]MDQ1909826.1 ABC-2 family transporter protein [Paenibacillus sp. GD4]
MNYFQMYLLLIRASVRSRMQYTFNFWFSTLLAAIVNAMDFLLISLVLWKFDRILGWSLYEIGYLYATIMLSKMLFRMFANDVHHLEKYLISGDLDGLLIRPLPILLTLMTQNFRLMPGELIQGGIILTLSLSHLLEIGQVSWWAIPLTILAVIPTGAVLLFAIGLGTVTFGFWMTRTSELQNVTEDAARTAVQYPLDLYPGWLKGILLTLVPTAMANYIPTLYVVRGMYGWWVLPAVTAFAFVFLLLMYRFWQLGLTKYQSTGS